MLPVEMPVSNWIVLILALLLIFCICVILKLNNRLASQYQSLLNYQTNWLASLFDQVKNQKPVIINPNPGIEIGETNLGFTSRATDADEVAVEEMRRVARLRKEQGIE